MEEEKAAAYYEELTRKGEGAARFKQGLGFSSNSSEATNPTRGSALPSSSSFLSSFVKASSPGKASEFEKQAQLENIQNKLKKKRSSDKDSRSRVSDRERSSRNNERDRSSRRTRSRSRDDYDSRRRRSLSREVDRRRDSGRSERSRRSRSRSYSDEDRRRDRDRGRSERSRRSRSRSYSNEDRRRDRDRGRTERSRRSRSKSYSDEERRLRRRSRERHGKRRSQSSSPQDKRLEKSGSGRDTDRSDAGDHKDRNSGVDYSSMIKGYADMTPAERVKAKMKLQLSQTADKDTLKGMGAGWERFEFNKDAPLDDEEIEVAEDDALVVKSIGQSFRFSAVEAKREEQIKAIHDEAMFGAPAGQVSILIDREPPILEDNTKHANAKEEDNENGISKNLISDKVLAQQQGSWRDRARKLQNGSKG